MKGIVYCQIACLVLTSSFVDASEDKVSSIESLWKSKLQSVDLKTKDAPREVLQSTVSILKSLSPHDFEAEYYNLKNAKQDLLPYQEALLEAFIFIFSEQQDEKKLVELIAAKCPRYIGFSSVEFFLVASKIKDPIGIFLESQKLSKDEAVKRQIVNILGSSFKDLRTKFPDDALFLEACADWNTKNAKLTKINYRYDERKAWPPSNEELFILK